MFLFTAWKGADKGHSVTPGGKSVIKYLLDAKATFSAKKYKTQAITSRHTGSVRGPYKHSQISISDVSKVCSLKAGTHFLTETILNVLVGFPGQPTRAYFTHFRKRQTPMPWGTRQVAKDASHGEGVCQEQGQAPPLLCPLGAIWE